MTLNVSCYYCFKLCYTNSCDVHGVILSELLHISEFFPLPSAAARLHTSAHHRDIFRGTILGHRRLPHPGCPRNDGGLFCQREQSAATVPINAKILRISRWLQLWLQRQHPAPATIGPRKILLLKQWHDCHICNTYREGNYGRVVVWWNFVLHRSKLNDPLIRRVLTEASKVVASSNATLSSDIFTIL